MSDTCVHTKNTVSVESLMSVTREFDRIMLEAVEAGIETGRSMGVIEAYNLLVNEGHAGVAEILMELINEDAEARMAKADA